MISGNRGEWSELYAFFFLVAEGRVFAADADLNKIGEDYFLPILKIIREDNPGEIIEYHCDKPVLITDEEGNVIGERLSEEFREQARLLYQRIVGENNKKRAFTAPLTEAFMREVFVSKIKASSSAKSDITTQIRDVQTGFSPIVGWSIKSELGSPPTLLNAGRTTNFIYEVEGLTKQEAEEINAIDTQRKIVDRCLAIRDLGGRLTFARAANDTFERNLRLIDTQFPAIIAQSLIYFYSGEGNTCEDIVSLLEERDPLSLGKGMYEYKYKKFLAAVALGMRPSTAWDGRDEASGGYIVITDTGDVVAFHIYNRDMFEDYLLGSTKFERASTTRHDYASLYEVEGRMFLNLNLQIRFR